MKVVDPRRITRVTRLDALWILILDVVAALEARLYEQDGVISFRVVNSFRPDVGGSYALSIENGVGSCSRIEGDADLTIDLDVLGALYLGGADAHAYAAAGRINAESDALAHLHRLFRTARPPWCNQVF